MVDNYFPHAYSTITSDRLSFDFTGGVLVDEAAAAGSGGGWVMKEQDRLLPIANVGRKMKQILPPNAKISKEAKETMQECVSEFISFVTAEASDHCHKEKRKTVNGEDVCWAIAALGFDDYADPLKRYLLRYRELEGERAAASHGNIGGSSSTAADDKADEEDGGGGADYNNNNININEEPSSWCGGGGATETSSSGEFLCRLSRQSTYFHVI